MNLSRPKLKFALGGGKETDGDTVQVASPQTIVDGIDINADPTLHLHLQIEKEVGLLPDGDITKTHITIIGDIVAETAINFEII